jgi:predicted permease
MAAVGIVLLIASANVAGLLLARTRTRHKEIALRLALGAGRVRIIRQLLTESVLLSTLGGALGILFAIFGAESIVSFVASGSEQSLGFGASIDIRVLLFTATITLLTGAVCGLAPAIRCAKVDLTPALKEGVGSVASPGHRCLNVGHSLVVGQIGLSMVMLVGAGLAVQTLQNLRAVDPGFDTRNILNFRINPELTGYKGARVDILYRDLQSRLSGIPSVTSVSYSSVPLLVGWQQGTKFHLPDAPEESEADSEFLRVGSDFFATMRIPLLEGRDFSALDFTAPPAAAAVSASTLGPSSDSVAAQASGPKPAIVNQTFVRRYLGTRKPLGQLFGHLGADRSDPGYVVIGVVRDAKYTDLRGEILPTAYVLASRPGFAVFELRTTKSATSIISSVRAIVSQVDVNLPISNIVTESESIDQLLFRERLIARLSSFFGVLALALASIGVYGLLSHEVTRRTREIGIRRALGAGRRNVLMIVVGQAIALAGIGAVAGICGAFMLTRYLQSLLYEIRPTDPVTFASGAIVLTVVSLVACYLPAHRATHVDPVLALRHE